MMFNDYLQEKQAQFDNVIKCLDLSQFRAIPLRYCNARVFETSRYTILQSYSTIVAIYDHYDCSIIVRNYYSATTQKHISLFIADFCGRYITRYNCYADSRNRVIYGTNEPNGEIKVDTKGRLYFRTTHGTKCYTV